MTLRRCLLALDRKGNLGRHHREGQLPSLHDMAIGDFFVRYTTFIVEGVESTTVMKLMMYLGVAVGQRTLLGLCNIDKL